MSYETLNTSLKFDARSYEEKIKNRDMSLLLHCQATGCEGCRVCHDFNWATLEYES